MSFIKSTLEEIPSFDRYSFIALLIFFSGPLRLIIPTTVLLEAITMCLLLFSAKKAITGRAVVDILMFLYFLAFWAYSSYSTLLRLNDEAGFWKEGYRLIFILIMLFSLEISKIDIKKLALFCLTLCRFHVLFTVYEFVCLNVLGISQESILLVGPAYSLHAGDQYTEASDNLGFSYIRPMGIMLQPQITGFVYLAGILLQYKLKDEYHLKYSVIWYIIFNLSILLTAAKTAVLFAFFVDVALFFKTYPGFNNLKRNAIANMMVLGVIIVLAYSSIWLDDLKTSLNNTAGNDLINDYICFLSMPRDNILLGSGAPNEAILLYEGFSCESSFFRLLYQFGAVNFLIFFTYILLRHRKSDKLFSFLVNLFFYGSIIHYCCIRSYFICFCLAIFLCLLNVEKKQKHNEIKQG